MEVFKMFYDLLVSHYHESRLDPDLVNNEVLIIILAAAILCVANRK